MRQYAETILIPASPEEIFAVADDHSRLSSHMGKSSWMMGGGKMEVSVDEGHGRRVGSHIKLNGKAFGFTIFLDEVVTRHEPPRLKEWETVGTPKLLVVGHYRMRIELEPQDGQSLLRVSIDYDLPESNRWLGRLFGRCYAKWCVRQMLKDVRNYFTAATPSAL